MHTQVYQKFIFYLSVFGVAISILVAFSDVIFGYLFELVHIIFEVIEMALDKVVEHVFETDLHNTQLIVFYILLIIGGILIYLVWKVLVQMFSGVRQNMKQECSELKGAVTADWLGMSMTKRVIVILVFLVVNYLASFLLF